MLANVTYGLEDETLLTDARLEESRRMCNLGLVGCGQGQGGTTAVGPRGARLSGGQKQRVVICRDMVLFPPPEGPQRPTEMQAFTVKETDLSTWTSGRKGERKSTPVKESYVPDVGPRQRQPLGLRAVDDFVVRHGLCPNNGVASRGMNVGGSCTMSRQMTTAVGPRGARLIKRQI